MKLFNALYYWFVLSLTVSSSAIAQTKIIANPFHLSDQAILNTWTPDQFTDPKKFAAGANFRFIYHGLYLGGVWIDRLLADPSIIGANPKVSVSVVDENHRHVFGRGFGFILEAPAENLVTTRYRDAVTNMNCKTRSYQEALPCLQMLASGRSQYLEGGVEAFHTLEDELAHTPSDSYNELIYTGTPSETGTQLKVKAVAINCDHDSSLDGFSDKHFTLVYLKCLHDSYDTEPARFVPALLKLKALGMRFITIRTAE